MGPCSGQCLSGRRAHCEEHPYVNGVPGAWAQEMQLHMGGAEGQGDTFKGSDVEKVV